MGRELGEGEIWVKRVVLTALRAWLAVVIKYIGIGQLAAWEAHDLVPKFPGVLKT